MQPSHGLVSVKQAFYVSINCMRPLHFGLKSPKERTPGPYTLLVTTEGAHFNILDKPSSRSGTLGKSERFQEYVTLSRRTGRKIGPGSYVNDGSSTRRSPRCKVKMKPNYSPTGTAASYMVGNMLVFDQTWNELTRTLPGLKSHSKPPSRLRSKITPLLELGRRQPGLNYSADKARTPRSSNRGANFTDRRG
jgi:hypothetical protein